MSRMGSPYYPPRATWGSLLITKVAWARRGLRPIYEALPSGVSVRELLGAVLVPGLGIYLRGHHKWGRLAMLGAGALFVLFIAALGFPLGNAAFGLLLSLHVTSLVCLLEPWLTGARFRWRIALTLTVMAMLAGLLYIPIRTYLEAHWFMPIRYHGTVYVINRQARPDTVRRNDWIAYEMRGFRGSGVIVQEGIGFGPVLGLEGDQVVVRDGKVTVNGQPVLASRDIPVSFECSVPKNCWYVQPELATLARRNAAETALTEAWLQVGKVSKDQLIGRPFKRWFWHRQS